MTDFETTQFYDNTDVVHWFKYEESGKALAHIAVITEQ